MASRATRRAVSPRELGFRKCISQKVGHATYEEALTAAEGQMLAGHVKPGCHITPYRCDECGEWHVENKYIYFPPMRMICLASGPSLTREDVEACRGRGFIIAINNTIDWAPWADVLIGGDLRWWTWRNGCPSFTGQKFTASRSAANAFPDVTYLQPSGLDGFEDRVGAIRTGGNSGYVAIQLAVQLGAQSIVLLGYDMQPFPSGEQHFHGSHPDGSHPNYRLCAPRFDTLVEPLQRRGIEIVNCSRSTALRSFPCRPLREVIGLWKSSTNENSPVLNGR